MGAYDPQGREIIASFAQRDGASGRHATACCAKRSAPAIRRAGSATIWCSSNWPEQNLETLKQAKVTKIVSICPHCVRTISTDWKEYGEAPPIEHHSEFMARHREKLPTTRRPAQKIVYHDPCYLGRYRGVYDEPRSVIALSGEVVDPPRARERSFCCGAGGGLAFLGEEKGERVSHNRAKELVATGARHGRSGLPVLQYDVSRRADSRIGGAAEAAGHRSDRRSLPAGARPLTTIRN